MKSLSPSYYPTTSSAGMRCCSTGHPVLADPLTGRTVCSCQIQSGVPAYLSHVAALSGNLYKSSTHDMYKPMEKGASAYVPNSYSTASPSVHPYYLEHMMAAQSYGAMYPGLDVNSIRRKTTNREATGPLKSWLYQHRKNPYPTKGEKIMLAIISQMTLTQVSTWFANARRRLKKESKMEDKDVDLSDIEVDDTSSHNDSVSSRLTDSDSENGNNRSGQSKSVHDLSDISDAEDQTSRDQNEKSCMQRLFSPDGRADLCLERNSSPEVLNSSPKVKTFCSNDKQSPATVKQPILSHKTEKNCQSCELTDNKKTETENKTDKKCERTNELPSKPKIWSIASML